MAVSLCIGVCAGIPDTTSIINTTFDGCTVTSDYKNTLDGSGISFISDTAQIRPVSGENAIDGTSLESAFCDLRWWSIDKYDDEMYLGFSVRVLSAEDGIDLRFGIMSQSDVTLEEIAGGLLIAMQKKKDTIVLTDHNYRAVAELEPDTVYHVGVFFQRGSQTYTISVNGENVSDDCDFGSRLYSVRAMRLNTFAGTFVLDNIYYDTKGRTYPQTYSMQEPGAAMPALLQTAAPDFTDTQVYVNDIRDPVYTGTGGAAMDLPLRDICEAAGFSFTRGAGTSFTLTANGESYTGEAADSVSLSYLNELLGAKIWYDAAANTILITTGSYQNDGILRAFRGKLYMNGQPYYEISFNKYDLFWQVHAEYTQRWEQDFPDHAWAMEAAEEALSQLHEMGFQSIRVFCSGGTLEEIHDTETRAVFFDSMEAFFDLCAKYDIKVVVCMNLISNLFIDAVKADDEWVYGSENQLDLIADPESKSRQFVKTYLTELITRFRDHRSVLMWEINNEGNLNADVGEPTNKVCCSILQLAEFYGDMADTIRALDPVHLITTGDSILRSSQWNLLRSVLSGKTGSSYMWQIDTQDERRTLLALLNEKYDVISIHSYNTGTPYAEKASDPDGKAVDGYAKLYMDDAAALGRPLYIGETALTYGTTDLLNGTDTPALFASYLDTYIDAGVQLTHWWAYHTDRKSQYDTDLPGGLRPGAGIHDQSLAVIQAANQKLKDTYVVNGAEGVDTYTAETALAARLLAAKEPSSSSSDSDSGSESAPGPASGNSAPQEPAGSSLGLILSVSAGVILIACAVLLLIRKKR